MSSIDKYKTLMNYVGLSIFPTKYDEYFDLYLAEGSNSEVGVYITAINEMHKKEIKQLKRGDYKAIIDFEGTQDKDSFISKSLYEGNHLQAILASIKLCKAFLEVFDNEVLTKATLHRAELMYKEELKHTGVASKAQAGAESYLELLSEYKISSETEVYQMKLELRERLNIPTNQAAYETETVTPVATKTSMMSPRAMTVDTTDYTEAKQVMTGRLNQVCIALGELKRNLSHLLTMDNSNAEQVIMMANMLLNSFQVPGVMLTGADYWITEYLDMAEDSNWGRSVTSLKEKVGELTEISSKFFQINNLILTITKTIARIEVMGGGV